MNYNKKVIALLETKKVSKEQFEKLQAIFPELKEDEDERMRKALINGLKEYEDKYKHRNNKFPRWHGIEVDEAIAWLEKQDAKTIKEALRTEYEKGRADAIAEIQNTVWSLDDENYLVDAIVAFCHYYGDSYTEKLGGWLKSLKERYTWKPSDEQMRALRHCCDGWQDNADGRLESLYNDLKKL
jgi:hypothetical protein